MFKLHVVIVLYGNNAGVAVSQQVIEFDTDQEADIAFYKLSRLDGVYPKGMTQVVTKLY